jgi:hypothetical protein
MGEEFIVAFELSSWAINVKRKVYDILDFFLFFLRKYEKKKDHNMFFVLYFKFKNLHLGFSFIGLEQGHFEKYDRKTLYLML